MRAPLVIIFLQNVYIISCDWVEIPQMSQSTRKYYTNKHYTIKNYNLENTIKLPITTSTIKAKPETESVSEPTTTPKNIEDSFLEMRNTTFTPTENINSESIDFVEDSEDEYTNEDDEDYEEPQPKVQEGFTLFGFLPFLKSVQESFTNHVPKGINGKVKMLEEFRDRILLNIEDRIFNIWSNATERQSRFIKNHDDDDHMEFPSAEGALITISFLTFAVFLIKLVLQVIQVLKGKSYSSVGITSPMAVQSLNRIKTNRNARKFSYSDEDIRHSARVLSMLDQYKMH